MQWQAVADAVRYEAQMQIIDADWQCLSTKLQSTRLRKKNLSAESSYRFRIRCART